jgi:hypothetical protein
MVQGAGTYRACHASCDRAQNRQTTISTRTETHNIIRNLYDYSVTI